MNEKETIPSSSPTAPSTLEPGKLIGAKPKLRVSHVGRSARSCNSRNARDLALFNLAIHRKLRRYHVVAVPVGDVAATATHSIEQRSARRRRSGSLRADRADPASHR